MPGAYTREHIEGYLDTVKAEGLREHGFPRFTANISILTAHSRRLNLMELFIEMMERAPIASRG